MTHEARVLFKGLLAEIEETIADDAGWCSLEKATALASILFAIRPVTVVELGVWQGGSAIPMAIALRHLAVGQLIAVDAWSAEASVSGQESIHQKWWGETMGQDGHDQAFQVFKTRLDKHRIGDRCIIRRQSTDEATVPTVIDVLHHDANHGPQAVKDVDRWAPSIRVGGFLIIDDLDWPSDHVRRARDRAIELGFVDLYPLGTGCVMQRVCS